MKLFTDTKPTDPLVRMNLKHSRELLLCSLFFATLFCGLAILLYKVSEDSLLHTLGALSYLIGVSIFFIGMSGSWRLKRRAARLEAQRNAMAGRRH